MKKPVHFIASAKADLSSFPEPVRREAGFAIYLAQCGDKSVAAVPMVGFGGASVLEVVMCDDGNAYRAVYTVKFGKAIYVLHAFQKKSRKGTETPKPDIRLIHERLKVASDHYRATYDQKSIRREKRHDRAS